MTDFEAGRYDGNGAHFDNDNYASAGGEGASSPQPQENSRSHGGADDHSDSKSQTSFQKKRKTAPSDQSNMTPSGVDAFSSHSAPGFVSGSVATAFEDWVYVMTPSGSVEYQSLPHDFALPVVYDPPDTTHVPVDQASEWVRMSHQIKALLGVNNTLYEFELSQVKADVARLTLKKTQLEDELASVRRELARVRSQSEEHEVGSGGDD